jgi:putative DNA primase/helicase
VFLRVLEEVMGDYARTAAPGIFTAGTDRHPTEIADLASARLVASSETRAGARWDDERLKSLSGGDPIKARFLYKDLFTFRPQFKLVFVGNHQPEIRDMDVALQRRIHMLPFMHRPEDVDQELPEKLREEYPGILAWAIAGFGVWNREGLGTAPVVQESSADYFTAQDAVQRWMDECTERSEGHEEGSGTVYQSWKQWANENGEYVGSQRRLTQALKSKGYTMSRDSKARKVRGLLVLQPWVDGGLTT